LLPHIWRQADRGHVVHFITSDRPVRLDIFAQNIFYHQVSPERYPLFEFLPYESALASKIVDVAKFAGLDILHVHYAIPHASAAWLAQQILADLGIHLPFVTTLHGTDITLVGKDETYAPVVTFSINRSDGVTSVSDYLRQATLVNFPIQRPIEVIPNFVDAHRFRPIAKNGLRALITPKGEKLLIHVSNFRKVKRVNDVYEVFHRVHAQMPAKLLLVGDGPDRSALERHVREEGMSEAVVFLGKQDVIEQILPVADLFLMPSDSESFGLAALEAMACGLPVLASNAGGLPELVEHGVSGMLSNVGDVDDMAKNALHILESDTTYERFAQAALARSLAFQQHEIVLRYEAYYESVIAQRPKAA
jgi:L-malate glycosyltransferase